MHPDLLAELSAITPEEERLLGGEALDPALYGEGAQLVVDSARLLESGKLITVRPHTRFVPFPAHSHNYVEIIYMCSGSTTHIINHELPLELRAGELLLLNQHVTHSIEKAGEKDIAVNFLVLPQFFDTAFDMIGPDNLLGRFLADSLRRWEGEVGYLHFQVADVLPVQNLVENMVWGIVNTQPNSRRINQVNMGLLFLQLLNHTGQMQTTAHGGNALVVRALREIEENYQTASLGAVAGEFGVSAAYLSRLVKEATGKTFKSLLQNKRLARADLLLRTTGLPIGEIIAAVGYDNTSHFYRIFRERYGKSPKELRHK